MTAPSQTADRMACAEAQSRLVPRPSAQSKKESPGRAKEFGHALSAGSSHLLMTSLPCRPSTALRRRLPAARRCARMEATRAPTRGLTHAAGIGGRDLDGAAAAAARTQSPAVMATGAAPMTDGPSKTPATPGSPVRPAPSGTQKEQVAVRDFCSRFRTGSRRDVDPRRAPCLRSAS